MRRSFIEASPSFAAVAIFPAAPCSTGPRGPAAAACCAQATSLRSTPTVAPPDAFGRKFCELKLLARDTAEDVDHRS
jgi:hypothetical protein